MTTTTVSKITGVGSGSGIDTSDANTVSVGVNGDYATFQAAIDFIETQTRFTTVTAASIDMPSTAKSWAQMSHELLIYEPGDTSPWLPSVAPTVHVDDYWFRISGDSFYYPLDSYRYTTGGGSATQSIFSKCRRPEAAVAGAGDNDLVIEYVKSTKWTILMLDRDAEMGGITGAALKVLISLPMHVDVIGDNRPIFQRVIANGSSNGDIEFDTSTVGYGRITFRGCVAPLVQSSTNDGTASLFEYRTFDCEFDMRSGSWWTLGMMYGSFEHYSPRFINAVPSNIDTIWQNSCFGDFILKDVDFAYRPMLNNITGSSIEFNLSRYVGAKNLIIDGFRLLFDTIDDYATTALLGTVNVIDNIGSRVTGGNSLIAGAETKASITNFKITGIGELAAPTINFICFTTAYSGGSAGAKTISLGDCSMNFPGATKNLVLGSANEPASYTVEITDCEGAVSTNTAGNVAYHSDSVVTASGAISSDTERVKLNNTAGMALTIARPELHEKPLTIVAVVEPAGTPDHTVTLTTGTWDGTNTVATFQDINDKLVVMFDSAGDGIVLSNSGVALS